MNDKNNLFAQRILSAHWLLKVAMVMGLLAIFGAVSQMSLGQLSSSVFGMALGGGVVFVLMRIFVIRRQRKALDSLSRHEETLSQFETHMSHFESVLKDVEEQRSSQSNTMVKEQRVKVALEHCSLVESVFTKELFVLPNQSSVDSLSSLMVKEKQLVPVITHFKQQGHHIRFLKMPKTSDIVFKHPINTWLDKGNSQELVFPGHFLNYN